ncbi:MAG: hypothetical protein FP831_10765 [Anaerolineae bacterium]|nr:hypothetical protein [Anaerolineae bacterium]
MRLLIVIVVVAFNLVSGCTPNIQSELSPTIEPSLTETPTIRVTASTTPTAKITLPPTLEIPDHMTPFIEGGYDKKSTEKMLYLAYDETSIHYLPENGIVFNERIIKSWVYVDNFEDGEYKRGIILDLLIRGGDGLFKDYGKFVWASSIGAMSTNPSMAFIVRNNKFFADSTPETSYPIMCAPLKYHETGEAQLYEGLFPSIDGKLQPVTIPGIGEVLPISNLFFADGPYCIE